MSIISHIKKKKKKSYSALRCVAKIIEQQEA